MTSEKRNIIVIEGATASGKTSVSIELAKFFPIEIISADSRQVFKYLNIGTAKATPEEQAQVPHHLIDFLDPKEYFSAGEFAKAALPIVDQIFDRGNIPVVVGGSGLYIKALCEGLFDDGMPDKRENNFETAEQDISKLYDELKIVDPDSAALYADKNPRRIARALEYFHSTGIPLSVAQKQFAEVRDFTPIYFAINREREELYDRINRRTEIMWHDGLLQETESVLNAGYSPELNSLNTVGYKETIQYINGEISELRAIELIAQHTRNYAKRQMTWFRRDKNVHWVKPSAEEIAKFLTDK